MTHSKRREELGEAWHHRLFAECHNWVAVGSGILVSADPYYGEGRLAVMLDASRDRAKWHRAQGCRQT